MTSTSRTHRRARGLAAAVLGVSLAVTGCAAPKDDAKSGNTITYWLWDSAQQPGYQKCADGFAADNPGLKVQIIQMGWNDYWSKLTAGFVADQAPDVFTNHLAKYAQFVDLGVLLPLDDLGPTKDITSQDYLEGLGDLWIGQDGKRYGAPKDWDTAAYFYNKQVTDKAGITEQQLEQMTWNPDDGGTFEKVIAHLTVDKKGRRGDEPGFDKNNVAVFGLATNGAGGDNFGQTQWSPYAFSLANNWEVTDQNPWGKKFRLDDPEFQKMLTWYYGLAQKGYMPRYETFGPNTGGYNQFASGKAALVLDGSWMISSYQSIEKIELRLAPTPTGPSGKRASMFNGLADSVTKYAANPENAAKWVAYLSSDKCQDVIGESGVVFPARASGTEKSVAKRKAAGLDVTSFTQHVEDGTTHLLPVTQNAADVAALTGPAFEGVYIGTKPVSDLTTVNNQVNKLFELTQK